MAHVARVIGDILQGLIYVLWSMMIGVRGAFLRVLTGMPVSGGDAVWFVYVEDDYYEDSPEDLYLNEDMLLQVQPRHI